MHALGNVKETIKLTVSYDGTDYHGFQVQPGLRTVQGVFSDVLTRVVKHPVVLEGSGRTDAGVHARGQVISLQTHCSIPIDKWPLAINTRLPNDLVVLKAENVPDNFHARFSAIGKTYRYTFDLGKIPDVFMHRYAFHQPRKLKIESMVDASRHLIGTHDFTSFCGTHTHVEDKVRSVYAIQFVEDGQFLHLYCTGSGFLYNMVRIVAGTLMQVGFGRWRPCDIKEILLQKDRTKAGLTAPAHGLSLWNVYYEQMVLESFIAQLPVIH